MTRPAPLDLLAVVSGQVVPLEAVPDPAFSEKMLGDGIAIAPEGGVVTAPCAGRIVQLHKARHAYGILAASGARVLVHVGLETVHLGGAGFLARVKEGQDVAAGQPLVEFDPAALARGGTNPLTVVVIENGEEHPVSWRAAGAVRGGKDVLLRVGGDGSAPPGPGPGAGVQGGGPPAEGSGAAGRPASGAASSTASGRATIRHVGGLHARPAALVARAAKRFTARVDVVARGRTANDLTQYALAMDRGHAALAPRLDGLHPAVLRLVAATAEGAARHGRWVGVCGGLAEDPLAIPLLVGLGVAELSVSPAAVAGTRQAVRRLDRRACAEAARAALALGSAGDVCRHVRSTFGWLGAPAS